MAEHLAVGPVWWRREAKSRTARNKLPQARYQGVVGSNPTRRIMRLEIKAWKKDDGSLHFKSDPNEGNLEEDMDLIKHLEKNLEELKEGKQVKQAFDYPK